MKTTHYKIGMEAGKPGLKRLIILHKTLKNVRLCPVTENSVTFEQKIWR